VSRLPSGPVRRLRGAPNAAATPQAAELLVAAFRTPEADLELARGFRQFGGHRPRAAVGALLEEGFGFDHGRSLLSESVFHFWLETAWPPFLFASALFVADAQPAAAPSLPVRHVAGGSPTMAPLMRPFAWVAPEETSAISELHVVQLIRHKAACSCYGEPPLKWLGD
jgi:hypothetical protein